VITSEGNAMLFADALARHQRGDLPGAEAGYRKILAADPAHVGALQHLGIVHAQRGRFADAEEALRRALVIKPDDPDILYNFGLTLQQLGRHAEAVACYLKMTAVPEVLVNFGNAYRALGRFDDAVSAYEKALSAAPNDVATLINLAELLLERGRIAAPIQYLRRAVELQPKVLAPHHALAALYMVNGEIEQAIAERETVKRLAPDLEEVYRELVLDLNLADGDDGSQVAAACRDWHQRFAAPLAAVRVAPRNDPDPDRRLRVGYVGGTQLRYHTLRDMLLPIIAAHDQSAVELYAYSDLPEEREDSSSAEYRRHLSWRRTRGLSDEALATTIRHDRIDVLIDPVGLVGGSRLLALARRPAPIQISFPLMGTCGGDTIDYVVADNCTLPVEAERHFSERVIRIPFAYCHKPPPADLPSIAPLSMRTAGGIVTFGSMNSLPKLSPRAVQVWSRILARVPNSRLLAKANFSFRDEEVRDAFRRRFTAHGIDPRRIELLPWAPSQEEHMAAYARIDVALDSIPYCGVTTTYETLAMGVPVVTRVGRRVLERYGLSILSAVGLEEGIARSDDEYVEKAVALAADPDRLDMLRRTLRDRLLASRACDHRAVASSLELAIREKWREWCASRR
jgi:predicted O-linked N-acetylglucosamine transferase (SPINDLY family)